MNKKTIGTWGEEIAATFFSKQGYDILERNYRVPVGEIDLICKKDDLILFVEVKVRGSCRFGGPEHAITPLKKARLIRAAKWYVMERGGEGSFFRFDCIFIKGDRTCYQLEHIESAFQT